MIHSSKRSSFTTKVKVRDSQDYIEIYSVPLIKIDLLSIEALDKIRACLDLLGRHNYIETKNKTLRQIYEDTIGIYKIDRTSPEMWKMVHEHKVTSLFQMEEQSGIKGIEAIKPTTLEELAALNSVLRLMAQEKGGEQPIDKFARFKKDISNWYKEMDSYGLTKEEQKLLEPLLLETSGMCDAQERFMSLVQLPAVGGHSLAWADALRKAVAKKDPAGYKKLEEEFYQTMEEKNLSRPLCRYVWEVLVGTSRGYGFNLAHTLSYSLIGLQEMNLAYHYPTLFWDTANLIVDSGAMNLEEKMQLEDTELKNSSTDYGKIATAIGKMQSQGIKVYPPDINLSDLAFTPDVSKNLIRYGIRGITRIGNKLIKQIMNNRPYTSIDDFLSKVKVNVTQMISLIKSGAFDSLYGGDRVKIMNEYIEQIADKKKRITLQNMNMLILKGLIPQELDLERRIFNFNKYIKKSVDGDDYVLDNNSFRFFTQNYDETALRDIKITPDYTTAKLPIHYWNNIYQIAMNPVRVWMKENQEQILQQLNNKLVEETQQKYAQGSLSQWEMDSLSFYSHDHELKDLKNYVYDIVDFNQIPNNDIANTITTKQGVPIPIYNIHRIAGTVIDKNKDKGMVILLTTTGVVTVKVWKDQFANWDKQISKVNPDGTKSIVEKSFFSRGNKLIITGIKRDGVFIPKKYKNTPHPLFEKILKMDKGYILESAVERADVEEI